jgi:hypothetical protein
MGSQVETANTLSSLFGGTLKVSHFASVCENAYLTHDYERVEEWKLRESAAWGLFVGKAFGTSRFTLPTQSS